MDQSKLVQAVKERAGILIILAMIFGVFLLNVPSMVRMVKENRAKERRLNELVDQTEHLGLIGKRSGRADEEEKATKSGEETGEAANLETAAAETVVSWPEDTLAIKQYLDETDRGESFDADTLVKLFNEAAEGKSDAERRDLLSRIASVLSRREHAQSVAFVNALTLPADRTAFAVGMTENLFEFSPATAAEWMGLLSDSMLERHLHGWLGRQWADHDLRGALDWAQTVGRTDLRQSALEGIAFVWAQNSPDFVVEWATLFDDPETSNRLLAKVGKVIAIEDPARAAEWSLNIPESPQQTDALNFSVYNWALQQRAEAIAWANAVTDPNARETALLGVANAWWSQESAGALEWVDGWEDETLRHRGLLSLARQWAGSDPASAMDWVVSDLSSGEVRESVFYAVAQRWVDEDLPRASRAIAAVEDPDLHALGQGILDAANGLTTPAQPATGTDSQFTGTPE